MDKSTTTAALRRRFHYIPGLLVRMMLALAFAWLVIMAFFATSVVSH